MKALALTAFIVVLAIGGGIAWLWMNPAPGAGEPRAVVVLDTATQPGAGGADSAVEEPALPADPTLSEEEFVLPPGVSIIGLDPNGGAGAPAAQAPQPAPEQAPEPAPEPENAPAAQEQQEQPGLDWQTEEPALPNLDLQSAPGGPVSEAVQEARLAPDGAVQLAAAPQEALIEKSPYGPLPRIGPGGQRPAEVYARPAPQPDAVPAPVRIAVLVVGLGLSDETTQEAITSLPGAVSLAFGPYGRNVEDWSARARSAGHEVLLQIPLEPFDYPDNDPGPHTLLTSLSPEENKQRLHWLMARFTGYVGLTNHMGAKFAAAQASFLPVLQEANARGLIFVDDGAAERSAAGQIAADMGLGFQTAQIKIDTVPDAVEIRKALARLETIAKQRGLAIGVASSLPLTIAEIGKWAEGLKERDIALIPVSAAARGRQQT